MNWPIFVIALALLAFAVDLMATARPTYGTVYTGHAALLGALSAFAIACLT